MSLWRFFVCCSLAAVAAAALLHGAAAAAHTQAPGAPCNHTENCSAPHSLCINRKCECAVGYEVNGTTCTIKLNSRCNATHICNRTGADCINNVCVCKLNYVLSQNYQNCVQVAANINQTCEVVAQCREFINSTCTGGACRCIPGHSYNAQLKSCQPSLTSGSATLGSPSSGSPNPLLTSRAGVFQPPMGAQGGGEGPSLNPQPSITAMAQRPGLYGNCTRDSNCTVTVPHSVCRANKCVCEDNYEMTGNTCLIKLNSSCNANTRLCNRTNAQCMSRKCVCKFGYNVTSDGKNCTPRQAMYVNEPCINDVQCINVPGTTCYSGVCFCNKNYFINIDRRSCVARTCIGNSCTHVGYAVCSNGYCVCQANASQSADKCFKRIGTIGDKCDPKKFEECYLEKDGVHQHVECTSGKCKCQKKYKADKSKKSCVSGVSAVVASTLVLLLATAMSLQS